MWGVKIYFVYMVLCADNTYYIGITSDLDKRVGEHNFGTFATCYTFSRRPIKLVWCQDFHEVLDAIGCEKKLKGWGHDKKAALVRGDFNAIRALSRSHTSTSSV